MIRLRRPTLLRPALAPLLALPVLLIAVVGVVATTPSPSGAGGAAAASGSAVTIQSFAFEPRTLEVTAGTEVTWTNRDSATHTVQGSEGLFEESADLGDGDSFSFTYAEPGSYSYFCGIHQYMRGEVVVSG